MKRKILSTLMAKEPAKAQTLGSEAISYTLRSRGDRSTNGIL
jgi:hypothetical protein